MAQLAMKRMARERQMLEKENEDYFAFFRDDDLLSFDAYVVGPDDSVYKHKLVKLHFDIPSNYPMTPPKVKFIQYTGSRIHPNLYVEGKVCLSILGTWPGEPWTFSMNCNTILITIRSLLDNQPYLHEPGQRNHPDFNNYVQYCTWRSLLIDYVHRETDEPARAFLRKFVASRASAMMAELKAQQDLNSNKVSFYSPYTLTKPNVPKEYPKLIGDLDDLLKNQGGRLQAAKAPEAEAKESTTAATVAPAPASASAPVMAAGATQAQAPAPAPAQSTSAGSQKKQNKRAASADTGTEDHGAPASKRTRK